jgi:formamidopyrimidine-DNA glycosylase
MPELPDVEVFKQYLDATALHQRIAKTSITSRDILGKVSAATLERALKGQQFTSSHRHGKYLFVAIDGTGWLVLHFGMTGFLKYFKNPADAPPHTRVLIEFANGFHLAYDSTRKLGKVDLVNKVEEFVQERELGPDALDPAFDLLAFRKIISGTRGTVKSALMKQQLIAGIGNVYSDEILFRAGIHPQSRSNRLSEKTVERLFRTMKTTIQRAVEYRVDPDRFPNSYLLPHRKKGGRCPRCGQRLEQIRVSGRTAYYCSKDQKRRQGANSSRHRTPLKGRG